MSTVMDITADQRTVPPTTPEGEIVDDRYAPTNGEVEFHVANSVAVLMDRGGPRAESVGVLRGQIQGHHVRQGRRALAVCATQPDVGCTAVAVNLAVSLAQVGVKTLLIDADMRQPAVADHIAPSRPVAGLAQYLQDEDLIAADVIQENVLPNLSVLYAGGAASSPQELLARGRFKTLIDNCLRDYDITIIDTPASNSSADARRIASVAGYAMMVVGKNKSYVHDVEVLIEELRADRTTMIGTVLVSG